MIALFSFCIFSSLQGFPHVVINEVMYNPDGNDKGKEWIELFNNDNKPINLEGCKLEKAGKKFTTIFTFPDIILQPDSFLVIGENEVKKVDLISKLELDNAKNCAAGIKIISSKGKQLIQFFMDLLINLN